MSFAAAFSDRRSPRRVLDRLHPNRGRFISGRLCVAAVASQLNAAGRGADINEAVIAFRLVLQLERVPCLPKLVSTAKRLPEWQNKRRVR